MIGKHRAVVWDIGVYYYKYGFPDMSRLAVNTAAYAYSYDVCGE